MQVVANGLTKTYRVVGASSPSGTVPADSGLEDSYV